MGRWGGRGSGGEGDYSFRRAKLVQAGGQLALASYWYFISTLTYALTSFFVGCRLA